MASATTKVDPPPERILLSNTNSVGDVILTTPIIRSVRNAYPEAYIAYLGERNAASLLEHNPNLDEIIPLGYSWPTVLAQPRIALRLRRRKFDLSINLANNSQYEWLIYLCGATVRVGSDRKRHTKLYTTTAKDNGEPKAPTARYNQFITVAGIEPTSSRTEIFLTDDERREARIYLQWLDHENNRLDLARPIVGIHLGPTREQKWLPERIGELTDMLVAKLGVQIVLVAGPNESEAVNAVFKHSFSNINLVRNLPPRQLAGVISHCSLFIANDADPMYIAVAVDVPTVGLFGSGDLLTVQEILKTSEVALRFRK